MSKRKYKGSARPMLSVTVSAGMLGCTPRRLREAIEAGEVPATKLGSRYEIAPVVIERILQGEPPQGA